MSDTKGKPDAAKKQDGDSQVEGEGSPSAAHHYNDGVKATVESGKVPEKADEARRALEGAEGEELRRAEKEAKERGKD
ncbi:MAG: hypothetical protein WKG00_38675 [Polyangiaceae bacterium]